MNTSLSAAVRRRAYLVAFLLALFPPPAPAQETAGDEAARPRVRRFLGPSAWLRWRFPDARGRRDPGVRLVRQEPSEPDLKVPAADRALGGGEPPADDPDQASPSPSPTLDDAPDDGGSSDAADLNVPAADRSLGGGEPPAASDVQPVAPARRPPSTAATGPSGAGDGVGTSPRTADLTVPAATRDIGGGRTPASRRGVQPETAAGRPGSPRRLMDLLGYQDSPVKVHGWIQNSYTGNTNGRGESGENVGVWPNHKANWWQGNQYYVIVEKPAELGDDIDFGFRLDNLFGNDWQWDYMQGLFVNEFPLNSFAAYNPAQIYGEVHLPLLTEGGIGVKGGRFFTIAGYEQVPATARPLLSTPYMFTFGQPFTHFGVLTTWHVTDRVNLYNGAINGWDRWIDIRYAWGYLGGFSWTSRDHRTTLAMTAVWGPNQFPSFLPGDQQLYLTGYVNVPSLAGLRNPGYWRNGRTFFTWVGTHKWTERLTQVVETDQGWERAIPGLASGGRNGAPRDATWFSFGNWFLYDFTPKLTGVWRSEIFWDPQGARLQNKVGGQFVGDRYHEMTLGLVYKPHPNLWIRPEARCDWSQYHPAYTDDARKSQVTLAVDAVIIW